LLPIAQIHVENYNFCRVSVLLWSEADVERIFSQLNNVKNKIRKQMILETVNTILGICAGLPRNKQCSQNYELSIDVLKQLGHRCQSIRHQ
jgi:hypothetical protein